MPAHHEDRRGRPGSGRRACAATAIANGAGQSVSSKTGMGDGRKREGKKRVKLQARAGASPRGCCVGWRGCGGHQLIFAMLRVVLGSVHPLLEGCRGLPVHHAVVADIDHVFDVDFQCAGSAGDEACP
jgi:hypothetical protein